MDKWRAAIAGLAVTFGMAVSAYLYEPPAFAQARMLNALAREEHAALEARGDFGGALFNLDLVVARGQAPTLRLSHPGASFINNQWISLNGPPAGGLTELAGQIDLTKRLPDQVFNKVRFLSYTFTAANSIEGEILLYHNSYLPYRGRFTRRNGSAGEELTFIADYTSPKPKTETVQHPRELADVLAQIKEIREAKNGQPKSLAPLSQSAGAEEAFYSDFDQDGLTDGLELFYGTDPANPDTDSDTFLDGDEIERGYDPTGKGVNL